MSDNESEREEPSDPEPKEEAEKPSQETSGSSGNVTKKNTPILCTVI